MAFYEEPGHYEKTILSDLQGAWSNLREEVVANHPFAGSDKLLFQAHPVFAYVQLKSKGRHA